MTDWYEVYDDEQVQLQTRQRVGRVLVALAAGIGLVVAAVPLLAVYLRSTPLAVAVAGGLVLGGLLWASQVVLRLRRVVWCVKLSVHRVVGYDYARRKTVLPWAEVERVEVDGRGLLVVGAPRERRAGVVLRIPALFPDFPRLSHRVVEYAEAHGLPVCIEGRPWQLLDVRALYPFMLDVVPASRPDLSRGRAFDGDSEPF